MRTTRNLSTMKTKILLAALLLVGAAVGPARAGDALVTQFILLAGFPESSSASDGVLVVPGTVIPLQWGPPRRSAGDDVSAVSGLVDELSRALRLADVEVVYRYRELLGLGEEKLLLPPSATTAIRLSAELRGFNEHTATYQIRFTDGSEVLADTSVNVPRGGRAVVGALDGEEAPYLFLAVEPVPRAPDADRVLTPVRVEIGDGLSPPRAIEKAYPVYPPEAKEQRITGVVILQTIIDKTGVVREIEILKGLPGGLSEAAAEAVRQWRFAPATDADGKPIDVYYNLTINFRLDKEAKNES